MPEKEKGTEDYYEVLQISSSADPDMIHRVYRLLAQRYHPDNQETGNEGRFRQLIEAYRVLGDPELRAQYDAVHHQNEHTRWRLVSNGVRTENDFQVEQLLRLTILEVLYTQRRLEPHSPGIFVLDLERLIGQPREHLEFTVWYLLQRQFVQRGDNSRLIITADGVDHVEQYYQANVVQRRLRGRTVADENVTK